MPAPDDVEALTRDVIVAAAIKIAAARHASRPSVGV
jgi:hypothetical protein